MNESLNQAIEAAKRTGARLKLVKDVLLRRDGKLIDEELVSAFYRALDKFAEEHQDMVPYVMVRKHRSKDMRGFKVFSNMSQGPNQEDVSMDAFLGMSRLTRGQRSHNEMVRFSHDRITENKIPKYYKSYSDEIPTIKMTVLVSLFLTEVEALGYIPINQAIISTTLKGGEDGKYMGLMYKRGLEYLSGSINISGLLPDLAHDIVNKTKKQI